MRLFLAIVASAAVAAWWVAPTPPAAPFQPHPCVKEAGPSDQDQKWCRDRYAIERAMRTFQERERGR